MSEQEQAAANPQEENKLIAERRGKLTQLRGKRNAFPNDFRRTANRRAPNAFKAAEVAFDPTDGSAVRPHRVNLNTGMYRGRQVLDVNV